MEPQDSMATEGLKEWLARKDTVVIPGSLERQVDRDKLELKETKEPLAMEYEVLLQ